MFYKESKSKKLDINLFINPTKEYRGAPFWSWNCELNKELLEKEILAMKKMGFGGFYMHPRIGMTTPYLSDEFMGFIKFCIEKGKKIGMNSYFYDEDNYPSGTAGGFTLSLNEENKQKYLFFTYYPYGDDKKHTLLSCFDILLDENGKLLSYKKIGALDNADKGHEKWFAYLIYDDDYCDCLQKQTIDDFINLTHKKYKDNFGEEFSKNPFNIFTDEPQTFPKEMLEDGFSKTGVRLPFTSDFDKTFFDKYNVSVLDNLPVLIWENADGSISPIRYYYHDHVAERFSTAFSKNIGDWCEKNGLNFTGHIMNESSLLGQTMSVGESMRHYKYFSLPGVDMLLDARELNAPKQAQSVAHQYGKDGVMSELYGVTNWDFDFRGHKLQGDWQSALGVTHRVPHLYWASMNGESKRDYPASIGHQSPWFTEYSEIENHFARINTVMTRGTPDVDIAVIHPIESYWLHFATKNQTESIRKDMTERFDNLTKWLIFGLHDFDFVSESLLPELYKKSDSGFTVGKMNYKTVIVPYLETIRKTTLNALKEFRYKGGNVVFMGKPPVLVDAIPSSEPTEFAKTCTVIPFIKSAILDYLKDDTFIEIKDDKGEKSTNLIYQSRRDEDLYHIFISHVYKEDFDKALSVKSTITIKGGWTVYVFDTLKGEKRRIPVNYNENNTEFIWENSACDSCLLELQPEKDKVKDTPKKALKVIDKTVIDSCFYETEEPNVLLLDTPSYSFRGEKWSEPTYVLNIDDIIRSKLGDTTNRYEKISLWKTPLDKNPKEKVLLKFSFDSDIEYSGARLALEYPQYSSVFFNGENVPVKTDGIFVDDAIKTILLPKIIKGKNELLIELLYGEIDSIESYYILGNFGVEVKGKNTKITKLNDALRFESITNQGLAFYGGNLKYIFDIEGGGNKTLYIPKYRGALIKVKVDGIEKGYIDFPPYKLSLGDLCDGKHRLELILYGNRMNTFGQLHYNSENIAWPGPRSFRTTGNLWTDNYNLKETGILSNPIIYTEE